VRRIVNTGILVAGCCDIKLTADHEAGCAPEPVWTFSIREKLFA
jgi:hypothetical protein